jgi:hypothetical protein
MINTTEVKMDKEISERLKKLDEKQLTNMARKIDAILKENSGVNDNTLHTETTEKMWHMGDRHPTMKSVAEGTQVEIQSCRYGKRDRIVFGGLTRRAGEVDAKKERVEISANRMRAIFSGGENKLFKGSYKTMSAAIGQMLMFIDEDAEIKEEQIMLTKKQEEQKHTEHLSDWGAFS